jgi:hypothetical protein
MWYDLYPETEQLESSSAFPACRNHGIGIVVDRTEVDFEISDGQPRLRQAKHPLFRGD